MSFAKSMISLARTGGKAKEGQPTTFSKAGGVIAGNHKARNEKQRDERMLDGLRELAAVWGRKSCD